MRPRALKANSGKPRPLIPLAAQLVGMAAGVAAGAALATITAFVLARVGALAWRRAPSSGGAWHPMRLFALWWFGAALALLDQGAHGWLALAGVLDGAAHETLLDLVAIPLCVGLWGLQGYLAFVWLGTRRWFAPLGVAYAALLAFNLFVYNAQAPWSASAGPFDVQLSARAPAPMLVSAYGALFAGPVLAATLAYASLWFKAPRGEPRYRIAMVSGAFALLFGALLAAFAFGLQDEPWFAFTYEVPALAASLLVLAAFAPPAAWRRRFEAASVA